MEKNICKFCVSSLSTIKDQAMIFGVVLCEKEFKFRKGTIIGDAKIRDAIKPLKKDKNGIIVDNFWGFVLEDNRDIYSFKEGIEVGIQCIDENENNL